MATYSSSREYELFAVLNGLFKWLAGRDAIDASPMVSIPRPKLGKSRDRVLTDEELQAVWKLTYDAIAQ